VNEGIDSSRPFDLGALTTSSIMICHAEYTGDHREKTGNCGNLVKTLFGVRFVYVDDFGGENKVWNLAR